MNPDLVPGLFVEGGANGWLVVPGLLANETGLGRKTPRL